MFKSKNKKIMYTPVNPSFTIYKWGVRGSSLHGHVFVIRFTGCYICARNRQLPFKTFITQSPVIKSQRIFSKMVRNNKIISASIEISVKCR